MVQVFVWLNSLALAPLIEILVTFSAIAPVLVTVTVLWLLLVPTFCDGKVMLAGENVAPAAELVVLMSVNMLDPGA